jgi:hypothetical protein
MSDVPEPASSIKVTVPWRLRASSTIRLRSVGTDIEFAQARDLDIECLSVWLNPTVLGRAAWRFGGAVLGQPTALGLILLSACDLVDALAVDLLRSELQLEALAHHAGKKAAHRVLLPAGCLHHRVNVEPAGGFSIAITRACLEPRSLFGRFALLVTRRLGHRYRCRRRRNCSLLRRL